MRAPPDVDGEPAPLLSRPPRTTDGPLAGGADDDDESTSDDEDGALLDEEGPLLDEESPLLDEDGASPDGALEPLEASIVDEEPVVWPGPPPPPPPPAPGDAPVHATTRTSGRKVTEWRNTLTL